MDYDGGEPRALILVVDDDWMNREVMEAHLLTAGYEVALAHNGEEALALSFERNPDVILLDVRMQGMSGYEVCEKLRANEQTQRTPVMMVTALDSDEEKQRALHAGADDFIAKPFTSLTMLARVKNLARISQLRRELRAMRQAFNRQVAAGDLALDAERRQVTVLCAGFQGVTASAGPRHAGDLFAFLDRVAGAMRDIVTRHDGLCEQWHGDTMMAYFGAPVTAGEDALKAVKAALAMRHIDGAMPGPGIGLHSGMAFAGKVNGHYTIVGDVVAAAYRLQLFSQPHEILASEETFSQVADFVQARQRQSAPVGHAAKPAVAYQVVSLKQTHV